MTKKEQNLQILNGSLLIAGTTIGAGMLGIPLITAGLGFLPAVLITVAVWLFMLATGLLFLEATLWMKPGANILSLSEKLLGFKGKVAAGATFTFLYYFLLIAYFAAGAPMISSLFHAIWGITLTGWMQFFVFALLMGSVVNFGIKWVGRLNYLLMAGLVLSYILLISLGVGEIQMTRLQESRWPALFFAAPILFSAFGYHNVIPSLTTHFSQNRSVMRRAIFWGTFIPFVVYIVWQGLIIGSIPKELLSEAMARGEPVTETLAKAAKLPSIALMGRSFGLFAIVTSLLGVSFSMVDFLGDGLKMQRKGRDRFILTLMTFLPPFLLASFDPSIFVTAIGIAGGFGEAFLNGLLPVALVYSGRYIKRYRGGHEVFGEKESLFLLFIIALFVMGVEISLLYR